MVNKTTIKHDPALAQLEHDIAYIQRSLLQRQKFTDRPNSHTGQRDNKPAAASGGRIRGGGGEIWGDKIAPKLDCHYFDPTCAAGGSQMATQKNFC